MHSPQQSIWYGLGSQCWIKDINSSTGLNQKIGNDHTTKLTMWSGQVWLVKLLFCEVDRSKSCKHHKKCYEEKNMHCI